MIDANPFKAKGEFDDVSKVEKYEMADEDYEKRTDSVRAFKARNKMGRFNPEFAAEAEKKENEGQEDAKLISKGSRCEVSVPGQQVRRGLVQYVGRPEFASGWWVGVQYDEPVGKNDGTVEGKRYFTCGAKYGGFVRPAYVRTGDYPEDLDLDDLDEM